jgi:methylglyoxal synthase
MLPSIENTVFQTAFVRRKLCYSGTTAIKVRAAATLTIQNFMIGPSWAIYVALHNTRRM